MKKIIIILMLLAIPLFGQDSNNVKLLEKINELRVSKGLKTLVYDATLFKVANKWGKYITGKLNKYPIDSVLNKHKKDMTFTHVDYKKRFDEFLKRKDVNTVSENLHFIMDTDINIDYVQEAFDGWKKSPPHYESMIDGLNTNVAFGYYYDKDTRRLLCILLLSENVRK
jgi:uncharacterized protein YkwD